MEIPSHSAISFAMAFLLIFGLIQLTILSTKAFAITPIEAHDTFQVGDVFVPGDGKIFWFLSNGTLNHVISGLTGLSAGMAFDSAGKLYVTEPKYNQGNGMVQVINTDGSLLGTFGSGYSPNPDAIVFDAAGNAYVSDTNDILKFDSAGNLIDSFDLAVSDFISSIDLAADQCTMYYSDAGIGRYNVCTHTQLPDFSGYGDYTSRILPNGDVLAVDGFIHLLNASGKLVKNYDIPYDGGCMYATTLDPDGKSFWAFSFGSAAHSKVDIETGEILATLSGYEFPSWFVPCDTITGAIAVFGELRAATPVYGLNLFEGTSPSDLVINLNDEGKGVAETSNLQLQNVTFRWINPFGDPARTQIIPLLLDGQKSKGYATFTPDHVGRWTLEADFGNGKVLKQTFDVSINVIPESPLGTLALIASSMAGLTLYAMWGLHKRKQSNSYAQEGC